MVRVRHFYRHTCHLFFFHVLSRGHNELDEPSFTQPQMYHKIRSRQSVPKLFEEKLIVRVPFLGLLPTHVLTPVTLLFYLGRKYPDR